MTLVFGTDNREEITDRNVDGFFHCRICHGQVKSARCFKRRHQSCLNENPNNGNQAQVAQEQVLPESIFSYTFKKLIFVVDQQIEELDQNGVESIKYFYKMSTKSVLDVQERTINVVLAELGLCYKEQYDLLLCNGCNKLALNQFFWKHLKRVHKYIISPDDKDLIIANCFVNQSPYTSSLTNELLLPLDFIDKKRGYRCSSCPYFCESKKSIIKHTQDSHEDLEFTQCSVQKLNGSCFNKYIGVQGRVDGPVALDPEMDANDKRWIDGKIGQILNQSGVEAPNQQSLFYKKTGWHLGPDNHQIPGNVFEMSEENQPIYDEILDILKASFGNVQNCDVQLRSRIYGGDVTKTFNKLQNESTIDQYAREIVKLIFFTKKVIDGQLMIIEDEIRLLHNALFEETSSSTVFDFLASLIVQVPNNSNAINTVIVAFIFYNCKKSNGEYLRAEEISKICARVNYTYLSNILLIFLVNVHGSSRSFGECQGN